jgi:hypothetical protein
MEPCKDMIQVDYTLNLVQKLMRTPHYAKLGETGIFAIVQKAKSVGMDVLDALNGSMYYVNGKVEMTAQAMASLIRSKGHSIQKDPSSTSECCILIGKRADNGDTMKAQFSMQDAKRAGLTGQAWIKYPEDMMFWRCLSRLSKQLYSDIIKESYARGEIDDEFLNTEIPRPKPIEIEQAPIVLPALHITAEQAKELVELFKDVDEEFKKTVLGYCERQAINKDFSNFPIGMYDRILNSAKNNRKVITHAAEHTPVAGVPKNEDRGV